jgi:chain length determinant protein (polysaccharide antigen chain regulator)
MYELSNLKAEETYLKSLKLNLDNLVLVRIDQPAEQPLKPMSPKIWLILALGLFFGVLVGVFIALMHILLRRNKSEVGEL